MTASKPKKRKRQGQGLFLWQVLALTLFMVSVMTLLLYSVYTQRRGAELLAGRPSPQLYKSPVDTEVVDVLATERERQLARAQIETVYSSSAELTRMVFDTLESLELPMSVEVYIIEAYSRPEGVTEALLPEVIEGAVGRAEADVRSYIRGVLESRLIATSQPNVAATEAARDAAAAAVRSTQQRLLTGQTIVREGEILTEDHLRVLEAVGLHNPRSAAVGREAWTMFGCFLMSMFLALPLLYGYNSIRTLYSTQQLLFIMLVTLLTLAAQRIALLTHESFIIVALVPLLLGILINEVSGIVIGVWLSIVVALFVPHAAFPTLLVTLTGAVLSSMLVKLFKARSALLLAGSVGGFAAAIAFVVYTTLVGGLETALMSPMWLLGGGVLAGLLALGLLPVAETNVGFVTEFRLLELMSPSSPLLQKLLLEAPGSYQHSLIISNLVEQAVANIGGNSLLARVGSLYHDVGKLKRPHFFAENQFNGENPHDHISPHLSYLIITSHVRDGVELLREYKLPKVLESFVLEHHGTTVLSYFYKRALEDSAKLDELNFRYPGPRPRTKEAAVLMLADAVESASRTLSDPSQGSIRALIDRLIEQRLQDNQLAESPLNFHDIEIIANTFERMMTAILHRRVRYPSAEEIQGLKRGGDTRRNPAIPLP